jgi:putative membrane protein
MLVGKIYRSPLPVGAAAFALATLFVLSPSTAAPRAKSSDQRFMTEAIQGDLSEVKMGKLAQEKGQGDHVKQFGKMLEQDHSEHLQQAQQNRRQERSQSPNRTGPETAARLREA